MDSGAAPRTGVEVIIELSRRGYSAIHAVEMPLTSLAEDAERTRKDGRATSGTGSAGRALLRWYRDHEMGNQPNVVSLVYIAAFARIPVKVPAGITCKRILLRQSRI